MQKRYRVTLMDSEREELQRLVRVGKAAARKLTRARILLLADQAEGGPAKSDPEIVEALGCGRASVERTRKRFVEDGFEEALSPKPSERVFARKIDGKAEAHLIALACGAPPEGRRVGRCGCLAIRWWHSSTCHRCRTKRFVVRLKKRA